MSKDRNLVLVVDDDLGMLRAIKRLLRQHDYEPILFSSAQAFKCHADFEKAACVILDINLNDGSRIELGQGLKAAGVAVPVIFITGNESPAVREAAMGSGCVAFLTKPFSAQELIEPLKKASATRSQLKLGGQRTGSGKRRTDGRRLEGRTARRQRRAHRGPAARVRRQPCGEASRAIGRTRIKRAVSKVAQIAILAWR